jgi:PAS domain S-box-containing protein
MHLHTLNQEDKHISMINIITELFTSGLLLVLLFLAFQAKHLLRKISGHGPGLALIGLAAVFLSSLGEAVAHAIEYFADQRDDLSFLFGQLDWLQSAGLTMIIIGGLLWFPDAKRIVKTTLRLTSQNEALSLAVTRSASDLEAVRLARDDERLLFLSGPMFSCQWQPANNWKATYISNNVFSILGYTSEELTAADFNFVTLLHPKDVELFLSMGKKILRAEKQYVEFDCRVRSKFDRYLWLQVLFRPDRRSDDGVIGYMLDITRQKQAEEEKERHLRRWKFALETGREGLWDWNIQSGDIELAKGWQALFGFDDQQLPTHINAFRALVHPDDIDAVRHEINQHLSDKTHFYSCEHRMRQADGEYIFVISQGKVMEWDKDGKPLRMVGKQVDITQQKSLQKEAMEASNRILEAESSRSAFVQRLGQEIRPKLNAALGVTDSLEDALRNSGHRQQTSQIRQALRSLLEMVNDISRFSQLKSGSLQVKNIDFNIEALCEDRVAEFYPLCKAKNIDISMHAPPDIPTWVHGTRQFLISIIDHLLSNAIKFTDAGEVHLSLGYSKATPHDSYSITIIDTGPGLPATYKSQLTKTNPETNEDMLIGKGLGLAIVKEIIRRLHGELIVESGSHGSTIRVSLPFAPAIQRPTTPSRLPVAKAFDADVFHIISPNAYQRQALVSHLQAQNATTFCHDNTRDCLNLLKTTTHSSEHQLTLIIDQSVAQKTLQATDNELTDIGVTRVIIIGHQPDNPTHSAQIVSEFDSCALENIDFVLSKPVTPRSIDALKTQLLGKNSSLSSANTDKLISSKEDTRKKRVLVAEDIEANQIVADGMLRKFGIQPVFANNGQEAVDMHKAAPFDLILMDCHMPVMDGLRATECIREQESLNNLAKTAIIAVTANNQPDQRQRCKRAGMDNVLFKPYSLEQIGYLLESRLNLDVSSTLAEASAESSLQSTAMDNRSSNSEEIVPVFDGQVFDRLLATLKVDRMRILVAAFLRECQSMVDQLPDALHSENFDEARRLVHSIKSSSANLGAMQLSHLAKTCEQATQDKNLELVSQQLPYIRTNFAEASQLIQQHLQEQARQA